VYIGRLNSYLAIGDGALREVSADTVEDAAAALGGEREDIYVTCAASGEAPTIYRLMEEQPPQQVEGRTLPGPGDWIAWRGERWATDGHFLARDTELARWPLSYRGWRTDVDPDVLPKLCPFDHRLVNRQTYESSDGDYFFRYDRVYGADRLLIGHTFVAPRFRELLRYATLWTGETAREPIQVVRQDEVVAYVMPVEVTE
jgi:hypothetical protein